MWHTWGTCLKSLQGGSLRNSEVTPTYLNAVSKEVRDRRENENFTDCELANRFSH